MSSETAIGDERRKQWQAELRNARQDVAECRRQIYRWTNFLERAEKRVVDAENQLG